MLKIRWSHDRLIFNMGIPITAKDGLYIEKGPWALFQCNDGLFIFRDSLYENKTVVRLTYLYNSTILVRQHLYIETAPLFISGFMPLIGQNEFLSLLHLYVYYIALWYNTTGELLYKFMKWDISVQSNSLQCMYDLTYLVIIGLDNSAKVLSKIISACCR